MLASGHSLLHIYKITTNELYIYLFWLYLPPPPTHTHTHTLFYHPLTLWVCLSGRFNYEGLVPHKLYFAGTLLGMSSCASYVSRTHDVIDDVTRSQCRSNEMDISRGGGGGGGVLPMWWVIHMCRGFDPLFSLWQDRARSFWGIFSHPPTPKRSFVVLKLPILTEFDLLGPKFHFSLDLFGSNFQRPAAHPHHFSDPVPPPPPPPPPPGDISPSIFELERRSKVQNVGNANGYLSGIFNFR